MSRTTRRAALGLLAALALTGACTTEPSVTSSARSGMGAGTTTPGAADAATRVADSDLPAELQAIMTKDRYADATWSLLAQDLDTGETFYALNADRLSFTGSTRKLFSVGTALDGLGADHRTTTPVHRLGEVSGGSLDGDLILVGGGDLTFGGRRVDSDTIAVTDLDHGDANSLGTAELTPQDPLTGLDDLAAQVRGAGITEVRGDVVVDDRLFEPYRVPNGNLLITPIMVNENLIDLTVTPTEVGQPATVEHRPRTAAFTVESTVVTGPPGSEPTVELEGDGLIDCLGEPACTGTVSGSIPVDYAAPISGQPSMVRTFRVEDPATFARIAFVEALERQGVSVTADAVGPNPSADLPTATTYPADTEVARFTSEPFAEDARLVLKVSLNQGANLALSLVGEAAGARTIDEALAHEREALVEEFGIDGAHIDFPTNGSGTPDSRATPSALVQLLAELDERPIAGSLRAALPVLGVDGSLSSVGTDLPARGHVFAKPGTTVAPTDDGGLVLAAQNLAGYIDTAGGRRIAYVVMVNDAGAVDPDDLTGSVGEVFADEGAISNYLYENL